jgi:hypothetical protein
VWSCDPERESKGGTEWGMGGGKGSVLSGRALDVLDGERARARVVRQACVRCVIVIGRRRKGGEIQ